MDTPSQLELERVRERNRIAKRKSSKLGAWCDYIIRALTGPAKELANDSNKKLRMNVGLHLPLLRL
jgi:hypothetical protein